MSKFLRLNLRVYHLKYKLENSTAIGVAKFRVYGTLRVRHYASLGQNLETIADTHHIATSVRMLYHFLHNRREAGNCAGAHVIAIRKTTWQQDEITTLQVVVFVLQLYYFLLHTNAEGINKVLVAVGFRENDYTKLHTSKSNKD